MKYLRLEFVPIVCLGLFAMAGCWPKPKAQIVGEPRADQPPPSPAITSPAQQPSFSPSVSQPSETKAEQVPSPDLSRLKNSVRPSVIWVSVFDSSGKLLRTQTGFFISDNGKFITTARAIEDGLNAVAKTGDGGIYNVSGVLTVSKTLDLAVLQADVKRVPFLPLNKNANLSIGTRVAVVGSGLAGHEGTPREATITTQQSDRLEIAGATSPSSIGSPVVDESGEVVGVLISPGEKTTVRPSSTLGSLLSQIAPDATAQWAETSEGTPTPRPTPKPRLVYAPTPVFPPQANSRPGAFGSGRFRLSFDANGNVRNIQIIQSTGNNLFDQAATNTLRQWKSAPGREWVATVPVTFKAR